MGNSLGFIFGIFEIMDVWKHKNKIIKEYKNKNDLFLVKLKIRNKGFAPPRIFKVKNVLWKLKV